MKKIFDIIIGLVVLAVVHIGPYVLGIVILYYIGSCLGGHKDEDNSQNEPVVEKTYEDRIRSDYDNDNIDPIDEQYLSNSLSTGDTPYENTRLKGISSEIRIKTGNGTDCDVVAIVKHNDEIVRNAYIQAGDSYTFKIPNGTYQVFFYGGKGWNPNKEMSSGYAGGFVTDESFSKDNPVSINHQILEYELILQRNGNFSTKPSNKNEIF